MPLFFLRTNLCCIRNSSRAGILFFVFCLFLLLWYGSFAITQLSSAKAAYNKIAEILRQNGYGDLAEATEKRLDDIETELIVKQKYEASLIELEKDIAIP